MRRFSQMIRLRLSCVFRTIRTITGENPGEANLLPGTYWHSTDRRPASFLFNNVSVGHGTISSMSRTRARYGGRYVTLGDIIPWIDSRIEDVFEAVRAERYPGKPSRGGAFFLFESKGMAESAWRDSPEPIALEARILVGANIHRGDFRWLLAPETDCAEHAAAYWAGEPRDMDEPIWERVVDGSVHFPGWRQPPFRGFPDNVAPTGQAAIGKRSRLVTCPICNIAFNTFPPNGAVFTSVDRSRCNLDPDLPILNDCPNVAHLVQSAWDEMSTDDLSRS